MPNITWTNLYSILEQWPGRLFEATTGTTVLTNTASQFVFRYPATHDFAAYRIVVDGTGFAYDAGQPISGTMTRVRIQDSTGATVITFGNLASNPFAADFSQFYSNVFGNLNGGEGPGPDGKMAWTHLMSGNDTINGTAGDDRRGLIGLDFGNDLYNMGAGDDDVNGGMGNDTINGGDGYDFLTYRETNFNEGAPAFRGATFNIGQNRVLDPWGGVDVISGFEEYEGSRFNDVYIGTGDLRDRFSGLRGRDTIDGGDNSFDTLGNRTEDRRDEVRYHDDYWGGGQRGIRVNLETSFVNGSITGTIRDGFGNLDTVIDIERVGGTRFDDRFVGSRTDNHFWGGEGKDSFNGGDGFDTLRMERRFGDGALGNVSVDLSRATDQILNDGFGNSETAINMEAIIAGAGNDTLRGNSGNNYIEGQDGRDVMAGNGGADDFLWWETAQFGDGDRITDFSADDQLQFDTIGFTNMTTTLTLVNGAAATAIGLGTFIFNAANDTLFWDSDGLGGTNAVAVVVLTNVAALTSANFELF